MTKETKLVYSGHFSAQTGNKVYLKPENMQQTGAYKVRGAYYKISTMDEDARAKGLITASAGNHAQGVAFAAKLTGVAATVCMPTMTPLMKINRTKALGANVVLSGEVFDDACARAYEIAAETGATFVHPFDDLDVATGQGTIAMEIVKELPTVDYILAPVGGSEQLKAAVRCGADAVYFGLQRKAAAVKLNDSNVPEKIVTGQFYQNADSSYTGVWEEELDPRSILPATVITAQPESASAQAGDMVDFTVTADGEELSYQWQYLTIEGEWKACGEKTSKSETNTVRANRDGIQYRCVVTGINGTVTSDPATLTVK